MLNAGDLDKYVNLQCKTVARADDGAEIVTYTTIASMWVTIDPLTGKEYWGAQQTVSEVTHNIIGRYRTGLRPDMRIIYGNRVFNILDYQDPKSAHEKIVYRCKEVLSNA